ncbi:MAG: hypothetical protein M1298_03665 [Chloroflexi bacterium]|nr:hypothetical protein [Chloroflexota bacterium]
MDRSLRRSGSSTDRYSPPQLFFLLRLSRLLRLKRQYSAMPHTEKYLLEMINKAMYSTFLDCCALEVGDDARELVERNSSQDPASAHDSTNS